MNTGQKYKHLVSKILEMLEGSMEIYNKLDFSQVQYVDVLLLNQCALQAIYKTNVGFCIDILRGLGELPKNSEMN